MQPHDATEVERLLTSGNLGAAAAKLDVALAAHPDSALAMLLQCELELAHGHNGRARQFVERALGAHLDNPKTCLKLLRVLSELSESDLMIRVCGQIPPAYWDSAMSLAQVAHLLTGVGAYDIATSFAEAGVARDAKHPPSLYALATLHTFYGRLDEAAELCERVLRLVPDDPGAWWLLSRLGKSGAGKRIDLLNKLLEATKESTDVVWLAYALHNELHECGEFDASWHALARACEAKRQEVIDSREHQLTLFKTLRAHQDWSALDVTTPTDPLPLQPIFVIGLHRSGTTLAEQILAGHSAVTSGGETYDFRAQLRRNSKRHYFAELDRKIIENRHALDYATIGKNYCRGMTWRAKGCKYVTDKLPSNYLNLGFIARALPQSKFICLSRDPIDVGFSSLRTLFSHAAPYSYRQQDFIEHYREYELLMSHWREYFPDRILDVDYHELTREPEQTTQQITNFIGITFEPQMLALNSRTNAVATASSVILRDGIRVDRGRVWEPYAKHLEPLLSAFG